MKVNCVDEVGLFLVDACCCKRLIFSWPWMAGSLSAVAIAFEIMPEFSPAPMDKSVVNNVSRSSVMMKVRDCVWILLVRMGNEAL